MPVCTGSRKVSRIARMYEHNPSVQNSSGRCVAQRRTRSISRRIRVMSRCSLTSPPSHKRVLTIIASAIHTMPPRAGPPRRYGALVKPKRRHNRLRRTPMGEQGHHQHHGLGRGAQPIEDGAFAGAERLVTRVADEALLLLRMDTDIALACLASGRAMLIGAECRRGVHACPPSSVGERTKRSMSGPPFALQVHLPTVACGATTSRPMPENATVADRR